MEEVSGGRMHFMFNRVGGLRDDLPAGWTGRARAAVAEVRGRLRQIHDLILGNEIFRARTVGVGVVSPEVVRQYGVSGPVARASGVDFDLRRDEPYLAYGELFAPGGPGRVVTQDRRATATRASAASTSRSRCRSTWPTPASTGSTRCRPARSTSACRRCSRCPRARRTSWTENPLGLNGYYLVSKGEKTPYRLKLRSASFNNVQMLSEVLPGHLVADMVAILGSTFFVVGDVDK